MYLTTYIPICVHTHICIWREQENLIKPGLYFIVFHFRNDKVNPKIIKNNALLASTCEHVFSLICS